MRKITADKVLTRRSRRDHRDTGLRYFGIALFGNFGARNPGNQTTLHELTGG
jgi:hypothetical protein